MHSSIDQETKHIQKPRIRKNSPIPSHPIPAANPYFMSKIVVEQKSKDTKKTQEYIHRIPVTQKRNLSGKSGLQASSSIREDKRV